MHIAHYISSALKGLIIILTGLLSACQLTPSFVEGNSAFEFEEVNGRVLVIRSSTYSVATPVYKLQAGDRVISLDNAEAILIFTIFDEEGNEVAESCQLRLPSSAQITLESYNDCNNEDAIELNNSEPSTFWRKAQETNEAKVV